MNVLDSTSLNSPWNSIYSLKRKASGSMKEETFGDMYVGLAAQVP